MKATLADIASHLGGELIGDSARLITRIAPLQTADAAAIAFLSNPRYASQLIATAAGCVIVAPSMREQAALRPGGGATLVCTDPYLAFARLTQWWVAERRAQATPGVHPSAVVEPGAVVAPSASVAAFAYIAAGARIGAGAVIGAHASIGRDASVGEGTRFAPRVTLGDGCRIGARGLLHSGVVIGADGFGFAPNAQGVYEKMPQVGNVILEDYVDIGANTTVDRATIGHTIIRQGTKLDNLVQVGHNAEIGKHNVIAAQTGIAGSTKVGDRGMIGGQVGIAGHLKVGDDVRIAAQSGIISDVANGAAIQGAPAFSKLDYNRSYVVFRKLPALLKRIDQLERELAELRKAAGGPEA